MVVTKNVTLSGKTLAFDNDKNLADELSKKQIVYIKGFASNSVKNSLVIMYDELNALISKSRDLVIVWDGDGYKQDDFTEFIKYFISEFIRKVAKRDDANKLGGSRKIDILGEPSGSIDIMHDGVQTFYSIKQNGLVDYLKAVGGTLVNPADDWRVKGMAMAHFLSTVNFDTSIKRPIIVYCLGGGETPKMEHSYIYGGDVTKLLKPAPLISTPVNFHWYLATPSETQSRVKGDNTLEVTHFADPKKVTVALHGTIPNVKMADGMIGKSAKSIHRVGKKVSRGAKKIGRGISSATKKVSSKIKKMREARAEKKANKVQKATGSPSDEPSENGDSGSDEV